MPLKQTSTETQLPPEGTKGATGQAADRLDPGLNPEGKTVISLTGRSTAAGHASVESTGALHTTNMQDVIDVIAPDP